MTLFFVILFSCSSLFAQKKNTSKAKIKVKPAELSLFQVADKFYMNKQYDLAIKNYNAHLKSNPDEIEVYYNRGLCYYMKEQYDLAIKDYTTYLQLNPENIDGHYYRGICYDSKELLDLAIKDYTVVLQLDSSYKETYYFRGFCYYKKDY